MNIDLATVELFDCAGHASHRLTLELDGTVTIEFLHGRRAPRVDPARRHNLTPHIPVPDALLDQAAEFRPW